MKTFYWFFRPLVIFSRFLGVVPLDNVFDSDPRNLQYKHFSFASFYSMVTFYSCILGIYFLSEMEITIPTTYDCLSLVIDLIIIRCIISYLLCAQNSKKLPKLILLLHIFDNHKAKYLNYKVKNDFLLFLLRILFPFVVILVLLFFASCESSALFEEVYKISENSVGNKQLSSYLFAFLSIWQLLPSVLYVYFSISISENFSLINKTLKAKRYTGNYFYNDAKYYDENMGNVLGQIRHMHNMLSECVYKLGDIYGHLMAIDRLCIICMFVVNISAIINGDGQNSHLVAVTILNALQVFTVILVSDYVKKSVSYQKNLCYNLYN